MDEAIGPAKINECSETADSGYPTPSSFTFSEFLDQSRFLFVSPFLYGPFVKPTLTEEASLAAVGPEGLSLSATP